MGEAAATNLSMGGSFSVDSVPSLEGQVVVIVGASSGIGLENARQMASKGAHVFMGCRTASKALPLVEQIKAQTGNEKVEFLEIDLLSFASVIAFAKAFLARNLPLHVLLNNAGVASPGWKISDDGYESTMQTNHLSLFLVTQLLLPVIRKSAPSRIVFCSSEAHRYARGPLPLDVAQLNDQSTFGIGMARYAHTKLCNVYTTLELSRRLADEEVYVTANHPGAVDTGIANPGKERSVVARVLYVPISFLFMKSPEAGSMNNLYLSASPDVVTHNLRGAYVSGNQKVIAPHIPNPSQQTELWDWSNAQLKAKLGDQYTPAI
eukprot:c38859_g1_i1.p1 GENE.c38859_g1_i1~~c38859_g1_i1.p1  ORF type:complete len:321 (-),score=57.37 c38859_g1_i1:56-1018(-)